MAGPMKEGEQAADQLGRRRLAFGRFLEDQKGGGGLAVNVLGREYIHQDAGPLPYLGGPALFQKQNRFFQQSQGRVISHLPLRDSLRA